MVVHICKLSTLEIIRRITTKFKTNSDYMMSLRPAKVTRDPVSKAKKASMLAQLVKALDAYLEYVSSISPDHWVDGENQLSPLSSTHMHTHTLSLTCTQLYVCMDP